VPEVVGEAVDAGDGPAVRPRQALVRSPSQEIAADARAGGLRDREVVAHKKTTFSACRAILRVRMSILDGMKRPCRCGETYTPVV